MNAPSVATEIEVSVMKCEIRFVSGRFLRVVGYACSAVVNCLYKVLEEVK
jgi:hypothetical protein